MGVLAVTLLAGHILDRTTGQPLPNVRVSVAGSLTKTDAQGCYRLTVKAPGSYTLTLQSNDVPVERVPVTLHAGAKARDVRACSTTLDYGCDVAPAGGAAG